MKIKARVIDQVGFNRTVARLAHEILERHGYTVLEASHGEEALALCGRHTGLIHLLVTDVVMPRMGGRALSERLAEARPELKVLYLSGYSDDAIVNHGVLMPGAAFLQKPFTRASLTRKVREVLDGVKATR